MKYIKIVLSIVFALAIGFNAAAADDEAVTCLTFHLTNGTTEYYELPSQPVVTFEGDKLNVTGNAISGTWNRADIEYFNFGPKDLSAIESISAAENALTFRFIDNKNVTVAGEGLAFIALYDINGRCAARAAAIDGVATVSAETLTPGVYIVEIPGHNSVKIIKR